MWWHRRERRYVNDPDNFKVKIVLSPSKTGSDLRHNTHTHTYSSTQLENPQLCIIDFLLGHAGLQMLIT